MEGDAEALEGVRWLWGRTRAADECLALHGQLMCREGCAARVRDVGPNAGRGWVSEEEADAVPRERTESWSRARTLGRAALGLSA